MRIFAIKNDDDITEKRIYGYLFYYENEDKYHIEIPRDVEYWEAPMIIDHFVEDGSYCIGEHYSKKWVHSRIIPPDRQCLGMILRDNKLDRYDEFRLLTLSTGRCAQDSFYITGIKYADLPDEIKERMKRGISDVSFIAEGRVWFVMKDGTIFEVECADRGNPKLDMLNRALSYYNLLTDVIISPDGTGIIIGGNFEFTREEVLRYGKALNVSRDILRSIMSDKLVGSEEAAAILGCSRQNIDDLVKRGRLSPVKSGANGNIFLKCDVLDRKK